MVFKSIAFTLIMVMCVLTLHFRFTIITIQKTKNQIAMRTLYEISSPETGTVIIRSRKISKALRRWLREKDVEFNHRFFLA